MLFIAVLFLVFKAGAGSATRHMAQTAMGSARSAASYGGMVGGC